VTAPSTGLPGETPVTVETAGRWNASKCATGTRPSSATGAPDFAVIYCSFSLDNIHVGWNLSAYESLQAEMLAEKRQRLEDQMHAQVEAWLARQ
jgi:hypothetical protein